jgi:hypothetical protein
MRHYNTFKIWPLAALLACVAFQSGEARSFKITPTQTFLDGQALGIQPGDTVLFQPGLWRNLKVRNIVGSPSQPIVFINDKGPVQIGNKDFYYALVFEKSRYFKITGTGSKQDKYGITIIGTQKGSGLSLNTKCSDFEIEFVEVRNTGFAGIAAKTDPTCDSTTWRGNFVMQNVKIHDNYIHDTGGEGMYIGNTKYSGMTRTCDGQKKKVLAHEIKNLRVYNNRVENTGWDGMQISMAGENCEIYGNTIRNFGAAKKPAQDNGIVIGGGTTGKLYNNKISEGTGNGIALFGLGENYLFNNLILNVGVDGIFVQDNHTVKPGWGFHILHNTIINSGRNGIRMYSEESSGNEFSNNIILNPGAFNEYQNMVSLKPVDAYIFVIRDRKIDVVLSNNFFEQDISKVGFQNVQAEDFQLTGKSPCKDAGKPIAYSNGMENDFIGTNRNQSGPPDIGMFEFK